MKPAVRRADRFQQGLDPCSGTLNHPAPHVYAQALLVPARGRDRGTGRLDGSARDAPSGSAGSGGAACGLPRRLELARGFGAQGASETLPQLQGNLLDIRFPDRIVVFEDPGTVPASATGRGYAFLGLTCCRTEARSSRSMRDDCEDSNALARQSNQRPRAIALQRPTRSESAVGSQALAL